jgi:uncharacterized repeat protein (TIGR01451 family)
LRPDWFAVGVTSDSPPEAFQGHHAEHLLCALGCLTTIKPLVIRPYTCSIRGNLEVRHRMFCGVREWSGAKHRPTQTQNFREGIAMCVRRVSRPSLLLAVLVTAIAMLVAPWSSWLGTPSASASLGIPGSNASCESLIDFLFLQVPEPGWVWVDPANKFQSVSGEVRESFVTHTDFPTVHDSHDQNTHVLADPASLPFVSDANDAGEIELEWEIGTLPGEDSSDPERLFPKWVHPSVGDRMWANGHWIFDCGHPKDVGGEDHFATEIHPPRAFASMRDQVKPMPGSGTTPVRTVSTDLYIHGLSGFVTEDLACGQDVILDIFGGCAQDPHRGTPIDADYDFDICTPPKPSPSAVLKTTQEDGPNNNIGTPALVTQVPATGPCAGAGFGPLQVHVHVPLAGTGVMPDRVYARHIDAGWIYPPNALKHIKLNLTKIDLHNDTEPPLFDCECSFWWMNVDRSSDEWFRLIDFDIPTLEDFPLLDPCFDQTNTLTDFDDDQNCGNGELNFSGPTYDFYVADGQPFTVRSNAYDQDCFDNLFGNHNLIITGPLLGACFLDLPDEGDNDELSDLTATFGPPGYGAGNQNIGAGDYNMLFTINSEALTVEDSAELSLIKACKPDLSPARAGQEITCTVVVSNPGPGLPRNVIVHDTLLTSVAPADYTMDAPTFTFSGGGLPSPCDPVVEIPGGKQFQCNLGTVPVGGSAIISYHITSNEGGDFNNFASVTTDSTDPNPNNNSAQSSTHVDSVSDLGLTKTAPASVVAGTPITWSLSLSNGGPSKAINVVVTDAVPAGVTITSVSGSGGAACTTGVPGDPAQPTTCNYGQLPAGPSGDRTMTINATVLSGKKGSLANNAKVSSDTLDTNNTNNVANSSTPVTLSADLALGLTSDPTPAQGYKPSTTIHYKVTVNNNGPSDADGVVVTVNLPPTSAGNYVKDDGGCTLSNATLTCNIGTFVAGAATRTIFIDWSVQGNKGPLTTTASVASPTPDPIAANNTASVIIDKK